MNDNLDKNRLNERKWSLKAANFDARRYDYFRILQREVISLAGIRSPVNFLDLGCGTGRAVCFVAKKTKGLGNFVGVDISRAMIEKARSNANGLPHMRFYQASSDHLPLESSYFDTIICTNSFHHYSQPVAALSEVQRVLKPQGRLYILDVTADDFFIRWIDRRVKAREQEHVSFYSSDEYAAMFAQVGLCHIASRRLRVYYPLKIHVAVKAV